MWLGQLLQYVHNNHPFILYANCSVEYDGRASSSLTNGHYLIIYKQDGSLQIHGGDKIVPRNYQGPKSKLSLVDNQLSSINSKDKIIIYLKSISHLYALEGWSLEAISINKTEKQLVDKLYNNWSDYIQTPCQTLIREYATDHGPVDIVGNDSHGHTHVVEVKRRKASIKDVTQLRKYLECFITATGYIAAPDISHNAVSYAEDHNCKYIRITFD